MLVLSDPNSVVVHDKKLVLMMICKAGNTSIKRALGDALDFEKLDVPARMEPHRRLDLYLPTPNKADAINLRGQGYLVCSVVRHPMARLVSCWADKIEERFHRPFHRKYGDVIRAGMPFREFVQLVCSIPDGQADQHFRSMSWDLVSNEGVLIPQHIMRLEDASWWERLRRLIFDHCGLDIGEQRTVNATSKGQGWREYFSPDLLEMAAERYAEDLERFGYDV